MNSPLSESDPSSFRLGRCVLVGLQFGVIIRELVEEDGYGQTIQDYPKGDADESKHSTQDGLWVDVAIAHCGDADLEERGDRSVMLPVHGNVQDGYPDVILNF